MATVTDVEVANASFPNVRQDLNDILEALATNFSADAEPSTMYANQFWYETDTNLLKFRNEDNDAWITLAYFDQTADEWEIRSAVMQAVDASGLAFKTDEGTTRVTIADDGSVTINTSLDVDNIKIDGNSITSTDTNGDINITPNGTGKVVLDGLNYPTADGTDGQVLTTDGAGNIAFEDAAGGGGAILQVVTVSPDLNKVSHTADAFAEVSTSFRASITPINASSTLLIRCTFQFGGRNTSVLSHFKIYDITNSADVNLPTVVTSRTKAHGSARQQDSDANDVDMMSIEAIVSAGSTTARTYGMYSQNESGSTLTKYFFATDADAAAIVVARPVFTIFEIAP